MRNIALAVAAIIAASAAGPTAAGDKGTVVDLGGLKSTAPATWKQMEPDPKAGRFRINQFAIPKADGDKEDAELVVSFLGKGSGGSNADNIKRWKGDVAPPTGKTIDDVTKVDTFKVGEVEVTYVSISGTYRSKFPPFAPNAKVIPKENFRFIGVIFDSKDGPFFLRLTGPASTVDANKEGFDKWLKGFK